MMEIVDHGEWVYYKPDNYPVKGLPSHILFARRVSDGQDWYLFARKELTTADTIKMTVMKTDVGWAVLTTTTDASVLFPAGARVIEVRGATEDHESFRMKHVDFDNKTFLSPPPAPPSMMQMLMEELGVDETKLKAKLDAVMKNRSQHG